MNKLKLGKKGYTFVAAALIVSMVAAVSINGKISSSANSTKKTTAKERLLAKRNAVNATFNFNKNASENEVVRTIVTLVADSVVETETGDVTEYTSRLKSQENKIIKGQENIIKQAEKITGNKVENQSAYLVNSFSIDATRKQMRQLAKIKGVESVYEASKYKTNMNTAVKEGNAYAQWNDEKYGYTGEGIVVAVLDTGVNYKHKDMVLDEGVKTKFTKNEWEEKIKLLGYGKYMTDKVPFGYNYCSTENDCLSKGEYHGYHVSGIIAGNNDKIQGVAKNAQLIGLKVLDDNGGGTTDDIVKGIEDAVKLGADVINMSLGMDCAVVSDEDFMQDALNNANEEGVICCIAAGNSGTSAGEGEGTNDMNMKDTSMVGTPAVAKSCLAVASADNTTYKNTVVVNAIVDNKEVTLNAIDPVGHGFDISDVKLVNAGIGSKNERLTVSAKKIKGNIAVATEGKSSLSEKVYCLSKAGAKGIILVSDKEEVSANVEVYDWEGVPVIVVGKNEGKDIIKAAKKKQAFSTMSITDNGEVHTDVAMSSFTSWGPTNELDIKPEITAPGGNIRAAFDGTDKYAVLSGTSMATPFVAGSEAVMLGAIKNRGLALEDKALADFLKNSLMNTADAIVDKKTGHYYSVRQQGSGMVDVYGAVDNDVLLTYNGEAKVELGEITSNKEIELTFTNYGKVDRSYTANDVQLYADYTENKKTTNATEEVEPGVYGLKPIQGASIVFSNNNIVVPAGKSVTVRGIVNVTNNYEKDSYVEAFIRFSGNGAQDIGLPVLGFYGDFDSEPIIDKSVYDDGESFVSSRIEGAESGTALVEMCDYVPSATLGEEITKEKTQQSSEITDRQLSKEDIRILKNSPTANSVLDDKKPNKKKAIPVNIGDTTTMTLINKDSYALYEIKAEETTGCVVNVPEDIYAVTTVYDSKMNMITTNLYGYFFGMASPLEFSVSKDTKCYVELLSLSEEVGKYDISFDKEDYSEENDIGVLAKEQITEEVEETYVENIKLNKKYNIKVSSEEVYAAQFKAKSNGYVTFDIDVDEFMHYSVYEEKGTEEDLMYGWERNLIEMNTVEGKFSKEIKVEKGSTYIIELSAIAEESYGYEEGEELGEDEGFGIFLKEFEGSLVVKKTDGSNYYTLKTTYNPNKVAFSPNGDSNRDMVGPSITQIRNAKEVAVKVLDSNKKVIREIGTVNDTQRISYTGILYGGFVTNLYTSVMGQCVGWDGTVYDRKTGQYNTVSEGQYYIQIEAKRKSNSLPQVITMPVKVDLTGPKLDNYEVKTENEDTLVYLQPSDDLALSAYYYVDMETKDEKYTYTKTVARDYATTNMDEQGRYVVNLGKTGKLSRATVMIEDIAGNVYYETVVGEPEKEEDDEFGDEFGDDYDEEYGEDYENPVEERWGPTMEVLPTEGLNNLMKFGREVSLALADNITYPFSFKIKASTEEVNEELEIFEYSIRDYVQYNTETNDSIVFGKKKVKNKKASEDNNELDGSNNISYKYEGKGIFTITLEKKTEGILEFDITDKDDYMSMNMLYLCENKEQYDAITNYLGYEVSLNLIEDVIRNEDVNEDGTFNITGNVAMMPESLKINGVAAIIDKDTLEFSVNIPIKHGMNSIVIEITNLGRTKKVFGKLYYNEMSVKFTNLPKADKKGVIKVNTDKLNLKGNIKSYMSIGSITLNGDNKYTYLDSRSYTDANPLVKNIDYNVSLQKGMNVITLLVRDCIGNEETVQLKVNYK